MKLSFKDVDCAGILLLEMACALLVDVYGRIFLTFLGGEGPANSTTESTLSIDFCYLYGLALVSIFKLTAEFV